MYLCICRFYIIYNNEEERFIYINIYREVRMRKKRKRLLQESQWIKEMDEKSDDKMQDKAKSETDDEKDTIVGIDDESQGDTLECKVRIQSR